MAKQTETTAPTERGVLAYKGFDANFQCRGFQFAVGETYTHNGPVERCESGFHACENPLDVWGYYGPFDSRFAAVELSGDMSREEGGDSKIAAGSIKIKAELKRPEFIATAVKLIIDACKDKGDDPSGGSARIGSSGDSARIKAEGKDAVIACAGSVECFEVGPGGCIAAPWHDGTRTRFLVGYEGEGLKAGVRYTVRGGAFVEVSP